MKELIGDAWKVFLQVFSNDVVQKALYPIMIAISLALLAGSYLIDKTMHPELREGLKTVSGILLTTGIISMFINAFTYMGIFRNALMEVLVAERMVYRDAVHEVLYSEDHLKRRNDLRDILGRVSGALYDQKFPAIADRLRDTIIRDLLPVGKDFYYEGYRRECVVKWKDAARSLIELTDMIVELVIVPADPNATINYTFEIKSDPRTPIDLARVKISKLVIDGEPYKDFLREDIYIDATGRKGLRQYYSIPLKGKNECRVKRTMIRTIELQSDPILNYCSPNFIIGPTSVRVKAKAPDLLAHLIEHTNHDFVSNDDANPDEWSIDREYHGLIFPSQGYTVVLQKLEPLEIAMTDQFARFTGNGH